MLNPTHIPAQVEGILMVTRNEEMRQHRVKTVLLEVKVTITVSAQEHERNQCRLDEGVQP